MLGALAGDIAGSVYEHRPYKSPEIALFAPHPETGEAVRFTDDSVCSVAVADWLLAGPEGADLAAILRSWVKRYPGAGYGAMFRRWAFSPGMGAYHSWGNGAAMRAGPCGWAAGDPDAAQRLGEASARVTHDHPGGLAGAGAVARAVAGLRAGWSPGALQAELGARFGYAFGASVADIRPGYRFDLSCAGTVPPAVTAALEARDCAEALRLAISLGGDSDTVATIAGALAEARFALPDWIAAEVFARLPAAMAEVVQRFQAHFPA